MKVTLGGDRLGSGNKQKLELNNYYRSTHNLSQDWISSMQCGILYPFMKLVAMRGDKFEIDLTAAGKTVPTMGPMFSTYKLQLDVFQCPMRLYQAILHNNPTEIGLKMSQVKLPLLEVHTENHYTRNASERWKQGKFNNSCLLKYLGCSGLGTVVVSDQSTTTHFGRRFNAIPILAYYDIFKNYYSNKQEENAYTISIKEETQYANMQPYFYGGDINNRMVANLFYTTEQFPDEMWLFFDKEISETTLKNNVEIGFYAGLDISTQFAISELIDEELVLSITTPEGEQKNKSWRIVFDKASLKTYIEEGLEDNWILWKLNALTHVESTESLETYQMLPFKLKNIDDMRMAILSHNNLGTPFLLQNNATTYAGKWGRADGTDQTGLPYSVLFDRTKNHAGDTFNHYPLNGLMVKTYQSDLYNNWVNTEWIDGENGIAAITAISTSGDSFKIDALNLAEKLYNMLNRVAVSGGTYEDWQDAVYQESPRRHLESPIYLGGMSSEIIFDEIVQNAPTEIDGESQPLGTLGGRGRIVHRKGGHITVKVDEASYIIGIVSITPRTVYTQGNDFDMTDLKTLDDLHKPALDGIGFENLIGERMAWFDTRVQNNSDTVVARSVIGKVPAWINYMTAVDKAYGDFAETEGKGFMVLNRNYEFDNTSRTIKDATTYVDPAKYNYVFAYNKLDAQNFWVEIYSKIRARRLMSAKQIPNI